MTNSMNAYYEQAKVMNVRLTYKRDFYAWSYGNYKAYLTCQDALSMYNMGNEL